MAEKIPIKKIKEYLKITEEDLKKEVFLKKNDKGVFFLVLNKKVNTFNFKFIREIHALLDKVEANEGPTSLITFGLNEKFYSTGIDL